MTWDYCRGVIMLSVFGTIAVLAVGCGQSDSTQGYKVEKKPPQAVQSKGHEHDDWWCAEHGVPEEECSQCNAKVAAEFKAKGDWCEDHDRAKSQCFQCDPKLKVKYASIYRAKEGKDPPATEDKSQKEKEESSNEESKP